MMRVLRFAAWTFAFIAAGAAVWFYLANAANRGGAKSGTPEKPGQAKEHNEHGKDSVELSDAKIAAANIELLPSGRRVLRDGLRLNGVIQANQETLVQVTARFPGIIKEVRKSLGDKVAKDEVLAKVESNQSLTTFELRSPIAGVVIDRQASLGEYASEQKPAFVVGDLSTVWIDFSVYRRDFSRVRVGDTVSIDPEDGGPLIEAKISYVSPMGAGDTQSGLARAVVPNDGRLRPGLFVTGRLLLTAKPVDVAVKLSALQTLEGRPVVFVRSGDAFQARDVELGSRDGEYVEVLFGLLPGDIYAASNSFVIKAELGKAGASHED